MLLRFNRDRTDLVALEAIRALFGALPTAVPPLFAAAAAAPPPDDPRDARRALCTLPSTTPPLLASWHVSKPAPCGFGKAPGTSSHAASGGQLVFQDACMYSRVTTYNCATKQRLVAAA